jgi:hypothetical protein
VLRSFTLVVAILTQSACVAPRTAELGQLSDAEFWQLSTGLSEPAGSFVHSDNLVSNETLFADLAQGLRPRGGVYIGVGPEQNFSYIARVRPIAAFIVDIREENRQLHLMYKALFETSRDRAEFVARLFSRRRPAGINGATSVAQLFEALDDEAPSAEAFEATTRLIRSHLMDVRRLPLSPGSLEGIEESLRAFYTAGPDIRYGASVTPTARRPSYQQLMTGTDFRGVARSYLATDEAFAYLKDLHSRNLIVPVVGDFAGPHALRRVGEFTSQRGQRVETFYASNVEVYLNRDQRRTFCGSLGALPHDESAYFISSRTTLTFAAKLAACARVAPSLHWP